MSRLPILWSDLFWTCYAEYKVFRSTYLSFSIFDRRSAVDIAQHVNLMGHMDKLTEILGYFTKGQCRVMLDMKKECCINYVGLNIRWCSKVFMKAFKFVH